MKLQTILMRLYKIQNHRLRSLIIRIIYSLEGGEYFSETMRTIFNKYYGVEIGLYSHGGCFKIQQMDRHTKIGRYCSIATTARVMNRNHPMEYKSMHAFFFNPSLKVCSEDKIEYNPLEIEHDVWIGHNAIIMPNVRKIGTGAVVAAGAVVNKDVLPYAVVVGNPARIVRYRFSKEKIDELLKSKWWEKSIEEIKPEIAIYFQVYEDLTTEPSNP